jgi:hypothetical protein
MIMRSDAGGLARPALRIVPDEPDQVIRLARFRQDHPGVIIGPDEFQTWRAIISEASGETVVVRHTLRELLDKLDELTGGQQGE